MLARMALVRGVQSAWWRLASSRTRGASRRRDGRRRLRGFTMSERTHNVINPETGVPIRAWTQGVVLDPEAEKQLRNVAQMPFVFRWVAAMPDVHWGIGATVGSVIPTKGAIIPAAV